MTTREQLDELKTKGLVDTAYQNITAWLTQDLYKDFSEELKKLVEEGDVDELNDAFYKIIPFGTAGRRGMMGVGSNRVNTINIATSAQGYADFLIEQYGTEVVKERGFVITYDVRHNSLPFAKIAAEVFAANGIPVYFFDGPRSTPQVSFSVRYFNAIGGAMISASHNPPTDNGIKIFGETGGILVSPFDLRVIDFVNAVTAVQVAEFDTCITNGSIMMQAKDMDHAYQGAVSKLGLGEYRDVHIVFTPMHGLATTSFLPVLQRAGFDQITELEAQMALDGDFTNVANQIPNPEVPISLGLAIDKAKECNADIVLAADPDADRIGVVSRESFDSDKYKFLNGNQIAVLLFDYITTERDTKNSVLVKTVVTTELLARMAEQFDIDVLGDLPVGFKYIADVIEHRLAGKEFLFGAEESHGYLYGDYARDKDGAIGALLISEYAAKLKQEGKTLFEQLETIQTKYGYYRELLQSVYYHGMDGMDKIISIMDELRKNPPKSIAGYPVIERLDQLDKTYRDGQSGELLREFVGFSDNALMFELETGRAIRLIVRPSGTEPKIKYYAAAGKPVVGEFQETKKEIDAIAHQIIEEIVRITDAIAPGGDKFQLLG